jgi:mannose-1-phosphate guanylyltransferase
VDAIVLVGGLGTRLRPLTWHRHKSLVPVCNRPAIDYLFDWLGRAGVGRVVLALGMHNEDLATAYEGSRPSRMELVIVRERARLESGGAIRNAVREAKIEGRFIVVNGDVFVDFDFQPCLAQHESRKADLTLALYPVSEPWMFGVAAVDGTGMVTGFVEKPPRGEEPSNLVNAGVWIFEPGLVDEIPRGPVRVEETLFPSLVARGRPVLGYRFEGLWADIGTPARYLELNRALLGERNALAGATQVASNARIRGSSVGAGCDIRERATVVDSVLWEGVEVGRGVSIELSIIADGVRIGAEARLTGVVIGANAVVSPGAELRAGTSIEPGATV